MLIVSVTVKPTVRVAPTLTVTGPATEGTNVVAPASECIAPREAAEASAERNTAPSGVATIWAAGLRRRSAGVRCSRVSSIAAGSWTRSSALAR